MKSIIINAPYDLKVLDYPEDETKDDEIEIEVSIGGVCGTDLHYYQHGGFGAVKLKEPMILGHEVSGYVTKLGKKVNKFKKGDLVAISPSRPCNKCTYCRESKYTQCLNMKFYGSAMPFPHIQGAFRQKLVVKPSQCFLATGISPNEAAMGEPLSVCLNALSKVKNISEKKVLIVGSGPIGTLCTLLVKNSGANHITVIDIDDTPLSFVKNLSVDECINVFKYPNKFENFKKDKGYFDITFECSGNGIAINNAIEVTKSLGTIIQVGLGQDFNFPLVKLTTKEINYIGSFRFHEEFKIAIDLMIQKTINLKPLITHVFNLNDAEEAFKISLNKNIKTMKTQIKFN